MKMAETLTPKEAMQKLSKSLREQLEQFKNNNKTDFTPQEAGQKVVESIRKQIEEYQDKLVKMRQLEIGEPLNKNVMGLSGPPQSESEIKAQHGLQKKSVFDILSKPKSDVIGSTVGAGEGGQQYGLSQKTVADSRLVEPTNRELSGYNTKLPPTSAPATSPWSKRSPLAPKEQVKANPVVQTHLKAEAKLEKPQPDEIHTDPKTKGAVLPSDKSAESQDTKNTGSGGQVKKGKGLKKGEPKAINSWGIAESQNRKNIFDSVRGLKPLESGNPTTPMRPAKLPNTVSVDPQKQVVKSVKNAQMPTKQQMKPKLPFNNLKKNPLPNVAPLNLSEKSLNKSDTQCESCDKALVGKDVHFIHPDTKKVHLASRGGMSTHESHYCKDCATRIAGGYKK
jgi:hypothetical protein